MRIGKSGFAGLLAVAALLAPLLPATAQNTDVIAERQQLMKNNARAARSANALIKGDEPFEAAKATEILQTLNADAKTFGTLFPEDSKTGGKTEAAPAIWEKPAEFEAANAKFVADTQAALDAAPADVEAFKTAFASVASNCQSCHQQFRQR
ncbi:cytochrome c [Aureimonas flava]|uniref:Cytochrome c n=1 Tax=Aureimonas flava TaxID=2320271 RepID=A0A3A1WU24_9HYPH|nr:cytochrome c [Aureimonas flava]RIY01923.1 cytochrome c [Aureimonas flava]